MKPNKKQREVIYWAMMFEIEAFRLTIGVFPFSTQHGFCYIIDRIMDTYLHLLPELEAQKPKNYYGCTLYWYRPGLVKPRMQALSRAIDLLHSSSTR